jgi:fructose-1-phosphate kinase PfkB-like protein
MDRSIYAILMRSARLNSIPTILHPREEDLKTVTDEVPTVVKLDYQAPYAEDRQDTPDSFMARAQELHRQGTEWAIASLGGTKVAFSSRKGAWIAESEPTETFYAYAAEDALLSGMIAAMRERASPEETARFAMACHWECASHPEKFPSGRARVEELAPRVLLSKIA